MDILIHKIFLFLRNVSEYSIVSITFLLVTPLVLKYLPPIFSGVRVSSMFESSISFIILEKKHHRMLNCCFLNRNFGKRLNHFFLE